MAHVTNQSLCVNYPPIRHLLKVKWSRYYFLAFQSEAIGDLGVSGDAKERNHYYVAKYVKPFTMFPTILV